MSLYVIGTTGDLIFQNMEYFISRVNIVPICHFAGTFNLSFTTNGFLYEWNQAQNLFPV